MNAFHEHGFGQRASIQHVDISEDGKTLMAANHHAYVFMWDSSDKTSFMPRTKSRAPSYGNLPFESKDIT
jgi:hypothetical protein